MTNEKDNVLYHEKAETPFWWGKKPIQEFNYEIFSAAVEAYAKEEANRKTITTICPVCREITQTNPFHIMNLTDEDVDKIKNIRKDPVVVVCKDCFAGLIIDKRLK